MNYRVVIFPQAEQDLRILHDLFAERSPATLPKISQELWLIESQLAEFPYAYQSTTDPCYRRAFLHSCRFTLYFSIVAMTVEVYAILPQRAGPEMISKRISTD